MAKPKMKDLDAQLGIDMNAPRNTKQIHLFGGEWTLVCDLNSFALADVVGSNDSAAMMNFIEALFLPEEYQEFRKAMTKVPNLDAEKLTAIVSALIEEASDFPTSPPSTSTATATRRTSAPKSAVASRSRANVSTIAR